MCYIFLGQSVFQWRNKLVPSHVANDGVGTESGAAFKILQRFAVEEEESGAEMTDTMEESRGRSVGGRVQQPRVRPAGQSTRQWVSSRAINKKHA